MGPRVLQDWTHSFGSDQPGWTGPVLFIPWLLNRGFFLSPLWDGVMLLVHFFLGSAEDERLFVKASESLELILNVSFAAEEAKQTRWKATPRVTPTRRRPRTRWTPRPTPTWWSRPRAASERPPPSPPPPPTPPARGPGKVRPFLSHTKKTRSTQRRFGSEKFTQTSKEVAAPYRLAATACAPVPRLGRLLRCIREEEFYILNRVRAVGSGFCPRPRNERKWFVTF